MSIEKKFAQAIVKTRYEDLPSEAVEYAKKSILDTMGAAIAGSDEPGCRQLIEMVGQWGGAGQATVWLYGGKVPVPLAALAIASMARAKELGDFHRRSGGVHATEYVLPAAFPMAEYLGNVSGKEFITAIALGQDIMCRLGMAVGIPTTVTGRLTLTRILGPTAACAKLLKLNEEQIHNALGIAYSGGLGSIDMQQYIDGSMTTYMHYGFCAEGATKSALLAQRGIRGTQNFLEGRWGYFNRVEPQHIDLQLVTEKLGQVFEGAYLSTKPYPSCGCTHVSIDAVKELVIAHDIQSSQVDEITIGMNDADYQITALPSEERYNPPNVVSARMSMPYAIATVVLNRSLFLKDFTPEALMRADVRGLMPKVKCRMDPELDYRTGGPVVVRIRTRDGKEYVSHLDQCKGHPEKPMSFDEIAEQKFRPCLPFSVKPITSARGEEIIAAVRNIERMDNVGDIANMLHG